MYLYEKGSILCLPDVDSCTLVSGASSQTVDGEKTQLITFFLDKSIRRPKGIVGLDEFWTHVGDGGYYQAPAGFRTIPVLSVYDVR